MCVYLMGSSLCLEVVGDLLCPVGKEKDCLCLRADLETGWRAELISRGGAVLVLWSTQEVWLLSYLRRKDCKESSEVY